MAKRSKPEPELPLFDLPLHPPTEGDDEAFDHELGGSLDPSPSNAPSPEVLKGQTVLPDLVVEPPTVVEPPKRPRSLGTPTPQKEAVGRESASTPRARLAERRAEELLDDHQLADDLDEDMSFSMAAPLGERALAGLADLGIQLLMLSLAALACHFVGVELSLRLWPPFVGLGLVLSFLYWIIPLAFWGQTPGMAWLGNIARSFDDEPLSFGQALLRWLGAWITAGLLGLPQLLALGGRSLSDRLSDSKTLVLPDDFDD